MVERRHGKARLLYGFGGDSGDEAYGEDEIG